MLDNKKVNLFCDASWVKTDTDETILYVKSENKAKKEDSMENKISERFIQGLEEIQMALSKKGGIKKLTKCIKG